jgi:hypothetical protein
MATAFVVEITGVTQEQMEALDVWESQEAFQRFVEMATPIAQDLACQPTISW